MGVLISAGDDFAGRTVEVDADDGLIRVQLGAAPGEIQWTWVTPGEARRIAAALVEAASQA